MGTVSSAGNTLLAPRHIPHPMSTGIARTTHEALYPGLWRGHVMTLAPCFYPNGYVFPPIGVGPTLRYHSTAGLRQWAWHGSYLTTHTEISPIGYGHYTGPGGNIWVRNGFRHCCPWEFRDSDSDRQHSYVIVFMLPEDDASETFQYLWADNPRLFSMQKWRGITLCFNTYTMTPQIWAGRNTSSTASTGCRQVYTQDDSIVEGRWHAIAWTVRDFSSDDIELAIDGEMYPSANMLYGGAAAGDPVYSGTGQVRLFNEADKASNKIAVALFQIFDLPLTKAEMCSHTADPLKMFWPVWCNYSRFGAVLEAGAKPVTLGSLVGMSETVLATTTQ
jgi:hypothetical protein